VSLLTLIACSDDYLLDEGLQDAVTAACATLGVDGPEMLGNDATPESVALEVLSPSLFSPQRVLVVADARAWLQAAKPAAGVPTEQVDAAPLVEALDQHPLEGVALVLGAWCGGKPKGPLVEVVERQGRFTWISLPAPPKPWEEAVLSREQRELLGRVLERAAPGVRFTRDAADLLLDRLGFAPRRLAQEATKLAAAAGPDRQVDEELVRRLVFPRERSIEVVRDALLKRRGGPLFDLLAASAAGTPVNDWQGNRLEEKGLAVVVVNQVASLLQQLLYLRGIARDMAPEMAPERTAASRWYQRVFRDQLATELGRRIDDDPASLLRRGGKAPTPWTLGQLFAAAGKYRDSELVTALSEAGAVEADTRGDFGLAAITRWLTPLLGHSQ
jgi:hypothetical protein